MPPSTENSTSAQPAFQDPLLNRFFLSPSERADKEKGKAIIKAFYTQQTGNDTLNNFRGRNAKWIELLLWAKGSQDMKQFLDYMSVSDANKAWSNIDLTQQRIGVQFVGTLVESMAKNKTYPCVKAIDDGSMSEKEQRVLDALFRMYEAQTIGELQQQAGVQLEPANAFVPDDELAAKVYFELEDRLPKEIRFEELLSKTLSDIKFDRVLNRKTIFDLTVLNFAATKIERVSPKQYTVRKCIPTNMVYNFFMSDTGELEITQIGEFYNLKVREFRAKFGKSKENPDGLTEKDIYELAKLSTNKNLGTFNYVWDNSWMQTSIYQTRPYDDSSILVFDCEINFEEDAFFVSKKDSFGKEDIQAKKGVPYQQTKKDGTTVDQPKPEGAEIITQKRSTWMRGVYAPYGDKILYWGKPDIIITPYTNVAQPLSSYSINIPNNDGEYVPSLFERIIEPLREYTITKLKRKQLIAQVRPSGIRIDVESARNIDLGNGDTIAWEEILRIYNQTGTELWSSKGVDPLQREAPAISNTVQDGTIQKIIELTNVLGGIVQEIRQLIGVPQYRDGSDVGDRTSGVLQEQQNVSSYNVTDFVLNGNNQVWEETCYKLCLLHWNDIVKEEPESKDDMLNTRFDVSIKMKSTEYQKQQLEADIQRYSQVPDAQGNPSLTLKDAMMIREIENYKLACYYLASTYESNRRKAMEESKKLSQENAASQQQSAQMAAEQADALQQKKLSSDKEMEEFKALQQMKVAIVEGSFAIAGKAENPQMPQWILPIIQQLVPNIMLPIGMENKQISEGIVQHEQQEQMQEQQAAMQQQQGSQQQQMPQNALQ
jgi:hypothetical protein